MTRDLPRRLVAEAIGTGILVFFGAGSVVAALTVLGGRRLGDYAALGMIAIAFSLAIAIAIYAFGTTSGAHINPAVTVSLALVRRFPWSEVLPYIGAQLAGALAGAILIVAVFGAGDAVDGAAVGSTAAAPGVSYLGAIVSEAIGTFLLLTAIMALAVDRRAPAGWAGLVIGLSVGCAILAVGPVAGASLNPARSFGPLLASTVFGGKAPWGDLPIYIIGPLIGGAAAALAYDLVARPGLAEGRDERARRRAQGTEGEVVGRRPADLDPAAARRQGTQGDVPGRRR